MIAKVHEYYGNNNWSLMPHLIKENFQYTYRKEIRKYFGFKFEKTKK